MAHNVPHVGLVRIINLKNIRKMDDKIIEFLDSNGILRGAGTMQSSGNYITIFELMQRFVALSQHDVIKNEVAVCDIISHNADIMEGGCCSNCGSSSPEYI